MSKTYRYIWISELTRGRTRSTVHFLFIIKNNGKSTREWPILKSNSTSFWFGIFFLRMNNKKIKKSGPLNFKVRTQGVYVTDLKWAGWLPVIPPHCVDNLLAFEEGGDSVPEIFPFFTFISQHLPLHASNLYSSSSSHHRMVGQVAFYSGITPFTVCI